MTAPIKQALPLLISASSIFLLASCSPQPTEKVDFATHIKPLLSDHCLPCHNAEIQLGGLSLQSRETAFAKSANGSFVMPGDPESSLIYTSTRDPHGKDAGVASMPASGISLTEEQQDLLRRWIEEGASWPAGAEGLLLSPKMPPNEA